jgi:hypothetical protein
MAGYLYTDLTVQVRHVPDYSVELDAAGRPVEQELPGFIELGVILDGVFVPLERRKASGLLADIERSRAQQAQQQPPAASGGSEGA